MFRIKYPTTQTDPPLAPRETLPTMYDLPSENPEEPGLPDEFHALQPELLRHTFRSPKYPPEQVFAGSDMNLYYDVHHHNWYKRPDWFGVVGVSRLYDGQDLRLSYVIWQEGVTPFVVVELLSPGTEKEDLGATEPAEEEPPTKWQVYEQILRVPYYVVFSRYTNQLRAWSLQGGRYQELDLTEPKIWMEELGLGLGLWLGEYQGINRLWLRWYDVGGAWIPTEAEAERQRAEAERQRAQAAIEQVELQRQRAEAAEAKAEELARRLREMGIEL
ncbi:MAG: Uma2 family endonuclease [Oscillatoriaceae cyanobacterium]